MSRDGDYGWYERAPKKPPPQRGIRMKKAGTTWWGQRWIEALEEVLRGDAKRLARGRTYARAGRTHDLVVEGGKVTAKVTGSRATPYRTTIALSKLGEPAWREVVDGLAKKAQFSAALLAGEMPEAIDEVFLEAGASLFPKQRADLETRCSCPDWGDPCKHVAATHYVLGEALDRDPFLLFELRGKTKEQVLEALRAARGAAGDAPKKKGRKSQADGDGDATPEVPTVKLGRLTAATYDQPREPLPSLAFSFEPVAHGAVLRQLGAPSSWEGTVSPADALAPLVRAAAETARRMAMTEPSDAEAERSPSPQKKRSPSPKKKPSLKRRVSKTKGKKR